MDRIKVLLVITLGFFINACVGVEDNSSTSTKATTELHDVVSKSRGASVPVSVLLPPNFDKNGPPLPLLIHLHGGGGDRNTLVSLVENYTNMFNRGVLPPMVVASFSGGPTSFYYGTWEQFVVDELPSWASETFGVLSDPEHLTMTGISMGGYGSLKIGFKFPDRFKAIAPMEPAIMGVLEWPEPNRRSSWWLAKEFAEEVWGSPFDPSKFLADNPANIAVRNADEIRASGLDIYLEVGDQDFIQLHDGAEFLHRVLWDHDIQHEYHLVRWADHVGRSLDERIVEAHAFLAASLAGGKTEPIDLPLNDRERAFAEYQFSDARFRGEPEPDYNLLESGDRAPSVHAALWKPLKDLAAGDPAMKRAYGELPATK